MVVPGGLPVLTGRVVDDADLLDAATESGIAMRSGALEAATGHQLVIATVRSLADEAGAIIQHAILPAFGDRDFARGISTGVDRIIAEIGPKS